MQARESHDLTLPPQAVVNDDYPYDGKIAAARRFLAERGITEVRPIYGSGAPLPGVFQRGTASHAS